LDSEGIMLESHTDERLLARLRGGDKDAIGDLADVYGAKIYQLAFRYLRNREDAEEVTQDVMIKGGRIPR
jgi:DNA-directed RNA polymerase specialized sigma24 family protein